MRGLWLLPALALLLAACEPKASDDAFGRRVRAYLLSHPEVLQEVAQRLDAKEAADLSAQADRAYDAHLAANGALFNKLSLGGTPAFIVGDKIILGEDMPAVDAAVRRERARKT